ncbi:Myosin and Myosin head and IQ calmodulin-binding region and Myosin tail domain containing protein [Aphelenchoides besseyi]|nr:Myosin and Myosin head and IQ calmodulin-binding region and Myosin tail domain containing protein [Aphelenchoides besseyi]
MHHPSELMIDPTWLNDPGWVYLRLSPEVQQKEQSLRKFDNKTQYWIADPTEAFVIGKVEDEAEGKVTVELPDGGKKTLNRDEVQEINPPKFEKTEDMANLTFLNEASVLHNLRQRYHSLLIYTYSGLFLVFINPYKRLPIYTDSVANMFVNCRRTKMPPHLFAVSDLAYRNMINDHENQSMLITGESGAGKTENTKKVISYFARIGAPPSKENQKEKKGSLEEQVVQANPAIEAFGNGATNRNYNSSRYGKFIRIHFNTNGKLVGGDIEHYLLEKSRVIKQGTGERSFHVFYQMMTNEKLRNACKLTNNIRDYHFVSQAEITVPGMNDVEEFACTDNAFDVMGFSKEEKDGLYKTCAAIMHMGEMKFKQKPREEQAEITEDMTNATNACSLFGVDVEKFVNALLKPQVKVGSEWVSKGQTVQQVDWSVGALAMAIYARMFHWVIQRCNKTLATSQDESSQYIGVLDIAGFEIFDRNSFEQLWINFVNEKLQQFFNHHMFVLEQEEYEREGIQWQFIDFGLDLQACIELIEKPLGIISMLDEECIVPKATDATYAEKLNSQHMGKHPNFQRPKPVKGKSSDAHFAIIHYAGTVNYNVDSWLDKNKDPLNDSAVAVLKTADHKSAIYQFWEDYQTAVDREEAEKRGKNVGTKKERRLIQHRFYDVSRILEQFVIDAPYDTTTFYSLHHSERTEEERIDMQRCTGRNSNLSQRNRILFLEFRYRYAILAANEASKDVELDKVVTAMLNRLVNEQKLKPEDYRVGKNKVFFRAGILARMEEHRDAAISVMIGKFQCACRHFLAQCERRRREKQTEAIETVQWNIRKWVELRGCAWYRLYTRVKPMLTGLESNAQVKAMEAKLKDMEEKQKVDAEQHSKLSREFAQQKEELESLKGKCANQTLVIERRKAELKELNDQIDQQNKRFAELESTTGLRIKSLEKELMSTKEKSTFEVKRLQAEAQKRQSEVEELQRQLAAQQEANSQLVQQRKAQEAANLENFDEMELLRAKVERLEEQRNRTVEELDQCEERLHHEKRQKEEALKDKRKLESENKQLLDKFELLQNEYKNCDKDARRMESEIGQWRTRAHDDANLISKLQANIRQLVARIEELETELEVEQRGRMRADKLKNEAQAELGALHEQIAETNGQLEVQMHLNKNAQQEVLSLHKELEKRNIQNESSIADLCSMQWLTLNNLRNLSQQAQFLENEANRVLDFRKVSQEQMQKPLTRSMSTREFYKHNAVEYRP